MSTMALTFEVHRSTSERTHHWHDGTFYNPWPSFYNGDPKQDRTRNGKIVFDIFKESKREPMPSADKLIQVIKPDWQAGPRDSLKATWLGHASFLVEFPSQTSDRGFRILFDPSVMRVLSAEGELTSGYTDSCLTGALLSAFPCKADELPEVDVVCLSHNHYDHLDLPTLRAIIASQPKDRPVQFFVPLKVGELLRTLTPHVTEVDWWDEVSIKASTGNFTIAATPAQHATGRGVFDHQVTAWVSYVVKSDTKNYFFTGDTGYRTVTKADIGREKDLPTCPAFKEIGAKYGPFDLACVPIGAYKPYHVFSPMHVSPEDAVEIHKDIKSKKSISMHYGTWVLTDEAVDEPPKRLAEALKTEGIPAEDFVSIRIGETLAV